MRRHLRHFRGIYSDSVVMGSIFQKVIKLGALLLPSRSFHVFGPPPRGGLPARLEGESVVSSWPVDD